MRLLLDTTILLAVAEGGRAPLPEVEQTRLLTVDRRLTGHPAAWRIGSA